MAAKSMLGSVIVGVICSVLIMSGLLYFIGPMLLPGLTEQDTDLQDKYDDLLDKYNDLLNKTLVLQYKYQEWNSTAYVTEYNLVYQKMNDTELSIKVVYFGPALSGKTTSIKSPAAFNADIQILLGHSFESKFPSPVK